FNFQTKLDGPATGLRLRQAVGNARGQLASFVSQGDLCLATRAQIRRLLFRNFGDHPHPAQIRDAVKLHLVPEMLPWRNVPSENESVRWRDDINTLGKLAAIGHPLKLRVAYAKIAQ